MANTTILVGAVALMVGGFVGRYILPQPSQPAEIRDPTNTQQAFVSQSSNQNDDCLSRVSSQASDNHKKAWFAADLPPEAAAEITVDLDEKLDNLSGNYSFSAMANAYQEAIKLPPQTLKGLITDLSTNPRKNRQQINLLVDALAQHGAEEALVYIGNNLPKNLDGLKENVVSLWAQESPYEAFDYILNADDKRISYSSASVFANLGQHADTIEIVDMLQQYKSNDSNVSTASAINGLVNGALNSHEKLVDLYQQINQSSNFTEREKEVFTDSWSSRDPEGFMQAVDAGELGDWQVPDTSFAMSFIGIESENTEQKADWLLSKVPDESRSHYVDEVATSIIQYNDPENSLQTAINWLEKQPEGDTEQSKIKLISQVAGFNPEVSISNLDRLSSDEAKEQASFDIYKKLLRQQPEKANDFLSDSPFKAQIEQRHQEERMMLDELHEDARVQDNPVSSRQS